VSRSRWPCLAAATALALMAAEGQADERAIRQAFKSKLPNTQLIGVEKLRYADLYEVTVRGDKGHAVFYTDALGKRLGATSTPTWFLPNGEKYMGAQPMSTVVPLLDATARRK